VASKPSRSIGGHLLRRRKALKLTQVQASRLLSVNAWSVRNWETGQTSPEPEHYPALHQFLNYCPITLPKDDSLAERVRTWRANRGLSFAAAGRHLDMHRRTVQRIENGALEVPTKPVLQKLRRLAQPVRLSQRARADNSASTSFLSHRDTAH
jgi:transcriptional regulator with XRE-family HTH domain